MTRGGAGIRPAGLQDAAEVARLAGELGYPVEAGEMEKRLAALLADPGHHIAVADGEGNRLLGWIRVEHRISLERGERAEIMGLIVGETARRTGIGAALVDVAEEWASARGIAMITVRSSAARAVSHAFYETRGYARAKTQHVYEKPLG